ncbi:MAG: hypothetical protein EHM18_16265, partial [Acidobacteria bacterium]
MRLCALIAILVGLGLVDFSRADRLIFPQFVSGELNGVRNSTRIILRNNGVQPETGQIQFLGSSGEPVEVMVGGQAVSALPYSLQPFGTLDLRTDGTGPLTSGVVEVQIQNQGATSLEGSLIYEVLGARVSVVSSPL